MSGVHADAVLLAPSFPVVQLRAPGNASRASVWDASTSAAAPEGPAAGQRSSAGVNASISGVAGVNRAPGAGSDAAAAAASGGRSFAGELSLAGGVPHATTPALHLARRSIGEVSLAGGLAHSTLAQTAASLAVHASQARRSAFGDPLHLDTAGSARGSTRDDEDAALRSSSGLGGHPETTTIFDMSPCKAASAQPPQPRLALMRIEERASLERRCNERASTERSSRERASTERGSTERVHGSSVHRSLDAAPVNVRTSAERIVAERITAERTLAERVCRALDFEPPAAAAMPVAAVAGNNYRSVSGGQAVPATVPAAAAVPTNTWVAVGNRAGVPAHAPSLHLSASALLPATPANSSAATITERIADVTTREIQGAASAQQEPALYGAGVVAQQGVATQLQRLDASPLGSDSDASEVHIVEGASPAAAAASAAASAAAVAAAAHHMAVHNVVTGMSQAMRQRAQQAQQAGGGAAVLLQPGTHAFVMCC